MWSWTSPPKRWWRSSQQHRRPRGSDVSPRWAALGRHVRNWRAMLRVGREATDSTESPEVIEARLRTGRPPANADWISDMEQRIQRKLAPPDEAPSRSGV